MKVKTGVRAGRDVVRTGETSHGGRPRPVGKGS